MEFSRDFFGSLLDFGKIKLHTRSFTQFKTGNIDSRDNSFHGRQDSSASDFNFLLKHDGFGILIDKFLEVEAE